MIRLRAAILASAALLVAAPAFAEAPVAAAVKAKPVYGAWGVDLTARDAAVKPGDDFWGYANNGWEKRTPIAADRTSAGVGVVLADNAELQVRAIVADLAKTPQAPETSGQQIGDAYASWMDEAGLEAKGTAPLAPYLARITAAKDRPALLKLFVTRGYASPVGIGISADPADPTRYVAGTGQSGLGLPNRDYYLQAGAKYDGFRTAYRSYVERMLTLAGVAQPGAKADAIVALEKQIATAHWTPERSRDVTQSINPMNVAQLTALAPQFLWKTTLAEAGLGTLDKVVVRQTSAIADAAKLLDTVPLATWRDYLTFHFIRTHAQYLPRAFDQANFDFYSKTLRDVPIQRDRWKRGVELLNGTLGEAVGQIYVQRHYPPESNRQMGELIDNLRASLDARIKANAWMDEPTKREALVKLVAFDPRIGHPVEYIDYAPLKIVKGDLLGNAVRAEQFQWALQLSRLGKPIDRKLWVMNPQTVNAYYSPLQNQITFPAAILQAPYFDPNADPAINYGAIGAVIGHEIGHGFDDQGRRFAADGRLKDWWTPVTAAKFVERADALSKQFAAYEPIPGVKINAKLTLGENLGDLGGLEMAYGAWRRYVAQHGEPKTVDGFTGDQRFFLSFAQAWRQKRREGATREQLLTDPHSPAIFRVNGIVRNVDAWYTAFGVKPGDKLYLPPEQRVRIW